MSQLTYLYWIINIIFAFIEYGITSEAPIVHYNDGDTAKGVFMETFGGRKISAFLGIPYATPPVGDNRFEPPKEIGHLEGVYDATKVSEDCLQYSQATYKTSDGIYGVEDCLYANIYTPHLPDNDGNTTALLDVVVYIHGGVFMFTYAHYGPKYLLDQNIILVTFNYRLGPLGFLSSEDNVIPGNIGLKDQNMLLRWVKKNINSFGGNPNSVTIAGTSAGSSSVHYHLISPLSKGLFQRAFSMSGTTLIPWAQAKKSKEKTKFLAKEVNCPTDDSHKMLACLKTADGKKIVEVSKKLMPWLYLPLAPFGPVIEVENEQAFLTEPPIDIIKKGNVHDVPWLVTMTSSEGLYPAADIAGHPSLMEQLQNNWNELVPLLLDYNYTIPRDKQQEVNSKIKEEYFFGNRATSDVTNMLRMSGDRLFVEGVIKAAKLHAKYNKSPAYSYYFTYRGKNSISDAFSNSKIDFGASHGDDTSYVLNNKYMNPQETKRDIKMIKLLTKIWLSFAADGKPKLETIPDWPTIDAQSDKGFTYVQIGSPEDVHIKTDNSLGNGEFWDSLGFEENLSNLTT